MTFHAKRIGKTLTLVCFLVFLQILLSFTSKTSLGFFEGKTLVCLGDSITSGYMIGRAYPEKLARTLGFGHFQNLGIPGSTLTTTGGVFPFVDRYSDMIEGDVIIVLFAGNDATHYVPIGEPDDLCTETVYGALNLLIEGIQCDYPNAYLLFVTPLKNENSPAIAPYVEATKAACRAHGVDLLDQFRDDIGYDPKRDTVDGIHLTQEYVDNVLVPRISDYLLTHYRKKP